MPSFVRLSVSSCFFFFFSRKMQKREEFKLTTIFRIHRKNILFISLFIDCNFVANCKVKNCTVIKNWLSHHKLWSQFQSHNFLGVGWEKIAYVSKKWRKTCLRLEISYAIYSPSHNVLGSIFSYSLFNLKLLLLFFRLCLEFIFLDKEESFEMCFIFAVHSASNDDVRAFFLRRRKITSSIYAHVLLLPYIQPTSFMHIQNLSVYTQTTF